MSENPSLHEQLPPDGPMPVFPEVVQQNYQPEQLAYASATTVGSVLHLAQEQILSVNHDALVVPASQRSLKGAKGEQIQVILLNSRNPLKNMQEKARTYTPIPESDSAPLPKPRAVIEIAEHVMPNYDVNLPADFTGLNKIFNTYLVYDASIDAKVNEPTIYKVVSMGEAAPLFIDSEEYKLAQDSENFHRISETEAQDLIKTLKTAIPTQVSKFNSVNN